MLAIVVIEIKIPLRVLYLSMRSDYYLLKREKWHLAGTTALTHFQGTKIGDFYSGVTLQILDILLASECVLFQRYELFFVMHDH